MGIVCVAFATYSYILRVYYSLLSNNNNGHICENVSTFWTIMTSSFCRFSSAFPPFFSSFMYFIDNVLIVLTFHINFWSIFIELLPHLPFSLAKVDLKHIYMNETAKKWFFSVLLLLMMMFSVRIRAKHMSSWLDVWCGCGHI